MSEDHTLQDRAHRWMGFGEYLYLRLFGTVSCSISMASGTGLYNPNMLDWDDESLKLAGLLGSGLDLVVSSGKLQQLIDQSLRQIARWAPSRREVLHDFIERSVERTLKWGSKLVPNAMVDRGP